MYLAYISLFFLSLIYLYFIKTISVHNEVFIIYLFTLCAHVCRYVHVNQETFSNFIDKYAALKRAFYRCRIYYYYLSVNSVVDHIYTWLGIYKTITHQRSGQSDSNACGGASFLIFNRRNRTGYVLDVLVRRRRPWL